jgi:hypothetical protein
VGGGSGLTGIAGGLWSGSAANPKAVGDVQITGSLNTSGSFISRGNSQITGSFAISGSFEARGKKGLRNTIIGELAGNNAKSDDNVFIGYGVGQDMSHAGSTWNVFIGNASGMNAGSNLTTANTAVGYDTLGNINGGGHNIAMGLSVGAGINSGNHNILIGHTAGYNCTTGDSNILIGPGAYLNLDSTSGAAGLAKMLRIGSGSLITISASLATGDIIFPSTASATYFVGDGSKLTSVSAFPFDGDAVITGSLTISGSFHSFRLDSDNIVLGSGSGIVMQAGADKNIILGTNAGPSLTTGDSNIFMGHLAGYTNITGTDNIFIGREAGYQQTGNNSVYIGAQAGYHDLANFDTFVGIQAGYKHDQGNYNTFLGYLAGFGGATNWNGAYNTCIGSTAGYSLNSGGSTLGGNTFVGYYTGFGTNSGLYNTFLGYYAGKSHTTTDYNIAIGYYAGDTTLGDGNILIGSGSIGDAGMANQLRIGSGNSLTTISASLVTGEVIGRWQRPVITHTADFSISASAYIGTYNIVGGLLTCSIQTGSLPAGAEFELNKLKDLLLYYKCLYKLMLRLRNLLCGLLLVFAIYLLLHLLLMKQILWLKNFHFLF